ncbi:hypothetical protein EIP91_012213 [Steccherinum ochraceum]|uniref:F-box domain-containing protein n=1 Tax=Steccherinum ochraceum TaxID=92696 RepID=A0A4R0RKY1_9APHY|nr:hypothetical protein EIP91_012213 [Steccherinum ochraceum]
MAAETRVFPPELVRMVLGFLRNEKPTLACCTLVSKSFFPIAQPALFYTISRHGEIASFVKHLQRSSRTNSYIHNLHLRGGFQGILPTKARTIVRRTRPQKERLPLADFQAVIASLPQLEILLVQELCLTTTHESTDESGGTTYIRPTISRLILVGVNEENESTSGLLRTLSCFSEIHELVLNTIFVLDEDGDEYEESPSPLPLVHSLVHEMSLDTTRPLCNALLKAGIARSLQSVDVICVYWEDIEALGEVLTAAGPSVKRVVFDPVGVFDEDSFDDHRAETWQTLCLARCTNLEELVLYVSLSLEEDDPDPTMDEALSGWSAARLAEQHMDWTQLEAVFDCFALLSTVTFELEESAPPDHFKSCRETIEQKMPTSKAKGRLRFATRAIERDPKKLTATFSDLCIR